MSYLSARSVRIWIAVSTRVLSFSLTPIAFTSGSSPTRPGLMRLIASSMTSARMSRNDRPFLSSARSFPTRAPGAETNSQPLTSALVTS